MINSYLIYNWVSVLINIQFKDDSRIVLLYLTSGDVMQVLTLINDIPVYLVGSSLCKRKGNIIIIL